MGYNTDFEGQFKIKQRISEDLIKYFNDYSATRHMYYDINKIKTDFHWWRYYSFNENLGDTGEFLIDPHNIFDDFNGNYVIDYNNKGNAPSLWCNWGIIKDNDFNQEDNDLIKSTIVWNGAEKFYNYIDWLKFIINNFMIPKELTVDGFMLFCGEDYGDAGYIIVDNNSITSYCYTEISYEELKSQYKNNDTVINCIDKYYKDPNFINKVYFGWDEEYSIE